MAATLKRGQLVILESTTYPGTTDEVVQPMLEAQGLQGRTSTSSWRFRPSASTRAIQQFNTKNIPKIVGGVGPASTEVAAALYGATVEHVVRVSSTRVAEMVKLLENTFRAVNIGLVNEIALMCHKMDIDVWEVIDAAKTKPFGFMPFYPGPGLGGHCIPIDPFYLSWKARQSGFECRFIELAGQVNASMPEYVVERVAEALNTARKPINGSRVHLFGVAYKRDVNDMRESPALDVLELLTSAGAVVSYTDPFVPKLAHGGQTLRSVDLATERCAAPPTATSSAPTTRVRLRRDGRGRGADRRHAKRAEEPHGARPSSACSDAQADRPRRGDGAGGIQRHSRQEHQAARAASRSSPTRSRAPWRPAPSTA